jgi:hypothetical protein
MKKTIRRRKAPPAESNNASAPAEKKTKTSIAIPLHEIVPEKDYHGTHHILAVVGDLENMGAVF